MMPANRQPSTPLRLWVMIPLLWLLLANQWAAAFAGHMRINMPAQPATHADMMMAMTDTMHVAEAQTSCESAQKNPCHDMHQQGAPASHNDHCNNAPACNLCHAPPAMLAITVAPETPTSSRDHHWRSIFYASIVIAGLDRPPASALA